MKGEIHYSEETLLYRTFTSTEEGSKLVDLLCNCSIDLSTSNIDVLINLGLQGEPHLVSLCIWMKSQDRNVFV